MTQSKSVRVIVSAMAMALLVASVGHGGAFSHENRVKFSRPVALPGVVLPAGTYSFDVVSPTASDVVVVRGADSGKLYYLGFTTLISRPRHMSSNLPIAFGEAAAHEPPPIAAWFELNDTTGHAFIYR